MWVVVWLIAAKRPLGPAGTPHPLCHGSASARMLSARRRHLSRRWRNVRPSSRVRVRVRVVPEAAHGVGRCVMPNVCAANARCKTFGTNVKCKTHLFWAAHQQNVPVQNVECKVWRKRLAALAFSPNVLHARSITFACASSNVNSGLKDSKQPLRRGVVPRSIVWRCDGVAMVRINACNRPISVTAS